MVALPLYKPQKGADQGEEGQRQSLVDLGTVSHGLMDRKTIARMSSLHWTNVIRMSGMLRYTQYIPQPDDIEKFKNINTKFDY